jgi:hypothetical protein
VTPHPSPPRPPPLTRTALRAPPRPRISWANGNFVFSFLRALRRKISDVHAERAPEAFMDPTDP